MSLPAINITLSGAQLAAINAALDILESNCPFRVNIPALEKRRGQGLSVKRYPYVKNVIENYAPANPAMQPGFMTLADAKNDFDLYNQFTPLLLRLASIVESYSDTQWLAGKEVYAYYREFFAQAERAKNNNAPGADSIYLDLKSIFEKQGPRRKKRPE
jgi:hypothetical protein